MSSHAGPNIVEDGLVLCLDVANPRSYPGTGNTIIDISSSSYNATATTVTTVNDATAGSVVDLNTSTSIISTFSTPVDHESWSLIYWVRSTGLTTSNFRGVIRLVEPAASHEYFYTVDTRETTNSFLLGYQKDFAINSWLTYSYMSSTAWAQQNWWCLGVSHNNTVFKHYTNGVLANTQTQTRNVADYEDLTSLRVNSSGSNTVRVGQVLFYQGILTDAQFQQNFAALRGRFGI
jgi:hypothetical protein